MILTHTRSFLCVTLHDHQLGDKFGTNPDSESKFEEPNAFILRKIITQIIENGHIDRLLLSNGVSFKTHL